VGGHPETQSQPLSEEVLYPEPERAGEKERRYYDANANRTGDRLLFAGA